MGAGVWSGFSAAAHQESREMRMTAKLSSQQIITPFLHVF